MTQPYSSGKLKSMKNSKLDIAQATIRTKNGKLYDLGEDSLVRKGINTLTDEQFLELFKRYRLRFDLTPRCNLWCIFCSNEGSNYSARCQKTLDIDLAIKLSDILIKNAGLRSIDFSGGEPTTHEDFVSGEYKLLKWTKTHPEVNFAIHSNGILLKPETVDLLKDTFSKIGISLHSPNFETWNKLTNRNNGFPIEAQKRKFGQILSNIDHMVQLGIGHKVFVKSVIVRGYNDSEVELKSLLDFCAERGLHPKFFEFEPQYKDQEKYVVGRKEFFGRLKNIGCEFGPDAPFHNDPNTYIPGVNFQYKAKNGAQMGLHSIFGCGDKAACETCYIYLCAFVKASEDGKGLYLKPCPVLDTRFDLTKAVKNGNMKQVMDIFKKSREYLMLAPGMGIKDWNKEDEFKIDFC